MKKYKIIIIVAVIVLLLAGGVWWWAASKKADETEPEAGSEDAVKSQAAADTVKMPLKKGSKGSLVKTLQEAINRKWNYALVTDGIWGDKTEKALTNLGLPTTIYWKQWSEITGKSLLVGGKIVSLEKKTATTPASVWVPSIILPPTPTYFM
ncbi:hypothetical protein JZU46_01145 [bacterium]|jgi:cytoskeletal protein RodZ|nr:hypothetical protein [bacterium]